MPKPIIKQLHGDPAEIAALSELLRETVAQGGSVTFMHPLPLEVAQAFWQSALISADWGKRIVLGAFVDGLLASTVTLMLDCPQNQPHRAEIAKMMTKLSHRKLGLASALLHEAERLARERGRTLLVLDTASEGGAAGLYESVGYNLAGEIPGFAYKPHGGLTGTKIYWKRL